MSALSGSPPMNGFDPASDTSRREGGAPSAPVPGVSLLPRFWKAFGEAHKAVYSGTDGLLGARLAWIPMLLLATRGRKTGLVRTMPLAYLEDPEEPDTYVVVASNGGSERPPAWWLNLQTTNLATVRVGRESFWVRAEWAPEARRRDLWAALRRTIPPYRVYERIEREIPIVQLKRLAADSEPF